MVGSAENVDVVAEDAAELVDLITFAAGPDDGERAVVEHRDIGRHVLATGLVDGGCGEAFDAVFVKAADLDAAGDGEGGVVLPGDGEFSFFVDADSGFAVLSVGVAGGDFSKGFAAVVIEAACAYVISV